MKKFFAMMVLGFALVSGSAPAADWNYVEAAVARASVGNVSATGYKFAGSKELGDNFFVQADYAHSNSRNFAGHALSASLGVKAPILKSTDAYGKVTARTIFDEISEFDKYGYEAEVGVRHMLAQDLEIRGGVVANNLREGRFDSIQYLATVGAEVAVDKNLRLGIDVKGKDNVLFVQAGARWYF